jgi:hypothetical protein
MELISSFILQNPSVPIITNHSGIYPQETSYNERVVSSLLEEDVPVPSDEMCKDVEICLNRGEVAEFVQQM